MDARFPAISLIAVLTFLAVPAKARDSEAASGGDPSNQSTDVSGSSLSSACKIRNHMPQSGCTDEDLCMFNPMTYAQVCKQVEEKRAKQQALKNEESAIDSALRNSDPLFSVEDDCSANAKTLGKGAALASVVPFRVKKIETADPKVPGWNIIGVGAKEVEVERCRFWFKTR